MTEKIKTYIGKIVKNGNAYHLSIPAHIRKYKDLDKGDRLEVNLTIVERANKELNGVLVTRHRDIAQCAA